MFKKISRQVSDAAGVILIVVVMSLIWLALIDFVRANSPEWLVTLLLALCPLAVVFAFQLGRIASRAEREGLAQGLKLKASGARPSYNPVVKKESPVNTDELNRALASQRQTRIRVQRSSGAETVDLG